MGTLHSGTLLSDLFLFTVPCLGYLTPIAGQSNPCEWNLAKGNAKSLDLLYSASTSASTVVAGYREYTLHLYLPFKSMIKYISFLHLS
jgi:hypothetical protein